MIKNILGPCIISISSITVDLCCREMVKNILGPVVDSDTELVRYAVYHV
jgi:hypothetical protein